MISSRANHRCLTVFLVLTCVGCASVPRPQLRETGGWNQYSSAHFELQTDLGPSDVRRAMQYLEQARTALLATAWPGIQFPEATKIQVTVLSDGLEFERLFTRHVAGFFTTRNFATRLVMYGDPDHWERHVTGNAELGDSVLKHELVHRLASYLYLRQPRWFTEGLARFLETVRVSPDGRTATLGIVNLAALRSFSAQRTISVADALAWGGPRDRNPSPERTYVLYSVSWALVHWLYNQHPSQFATFQQELARGADPTAAWTHMFPRSTLEEIDREVYAYTRHGEFQKFTYPLTPQAVEVTSRPLSAVEVHVLRSQLALEAVFLSSERTREHVLEAKAEAAAALSTDPTDARALMADDTHRTPGTQLEAASRSVHAHPADPIAWFLYGRALQMTDRGGAKAQAAYHKAVIVDPGFSEAFNALAWIHLMNRRPQDALPFAQRAVRLAPWSAANVDTLAGALSGVGRCGDALQVQNHAIDLLNERLSAQDRKPYLDHLETVKTRCHPVETPVTTEASRNTVTQLLII